VGRRPNGRPDIKYTQPSEQKLIGAPTPALVTPAVSAKAQQTIGRMRSYTNHINTYKVFRMLAGMVRCGQCGGCMPTQKIPGRGGAVYHYYTCLNRRNKQTECANPRQQIGAVEASVWEQVCSFLGDDAAIRRAVANARGQQADIARELEHHREALRLAEKMAAGLVATLSGLEDAVVTEPVRKRLLGLSEQTAGHRRAIQDLETRIMAEDAMVMSL
jgi:hypothetical protein